VCCCATLHAWLEDELMWRWDPHIKKRGKENADDGPGLQRRADMHAYAVRLGWLIGVGLNPARSLVFFFSFLNSRNIKKYIWIPHVHIKI
jgi:hypothetical protein